jgi:hypothetical protein
VFELLPVFEPLDVPDVLLGEPLLFELDGVTDWFDPLVVELFEPDCVPVFEPLDFEPEPDEFQSLVDERFIEPDVLVLLPLCVLLLLLDPPRCSAHPTNATAAARMIRCFFMWFSFLIPGLFFSPNQRAATATSVPTLGRRKHGVNSSNKIAVADTREREV